MSAKDTLLRLWFEKRSDKLDKDLLFEVFKDIPHGVDSGGTCVVSWGTPGAEAAQVITTELQLTDVGGANWAEAAIVRLTCTAPGTMAIGAAAHGAVISGSGTNDMLVQTSTTGAFTLAVTDTTAILAGDIYTMVGPTQGSPSLDARVVLTNTFA